MAGESGAARRSEKASTVSTLSTFSTSTPSTPGGLLPKIQRLTVPQVWLGPCPYPTHSEKPVFKLRWSFAATWLDQEARYEAQSRTNYCLRE